MDIIQYQINIYIMKFIKTFEGSQNTDLFNDIKEIEYILKDEGIEFLDYFESNSGPSVSLWGSRSISIYIRVPFYQRSDFSTEKNFRKGLKNEILGGSYFSEYLDRIYEMYCQ